MQSVKQEPIYLPHVENHPQPSHYLDLIRTSPSTGGETWNIRYLFASRLEMTHHLARFTQEVMRQPSQLSSGVRELIAAHTSYVNQCEFCIKARVAVAAELPGSQDLVRSGLHDLDASSLKEGEKGFARFTGKMTSNLPSITEADVKSLAGRSVGTTTPSSIPTRARCSISTIDGLQSPVPVPLRIKATDYKAKSWHD